MGERVSALKITEAESNPLGKDSGNEWVELYSDSDLSLDNYFLENGDGDLFNLSGSINGYLVITFSGLWLDNLNETIFLKFNGDVIDEVPVFADSKNNDLTFSLCNNEWDMATSTKGEDNSCGQSAPEEVIDNVVEDESSDSLIEEDNNNTVNSSVNSLDNLVASKDNLVETKNEKIVLSNPSKSNSDSGVEITKSYKTRIGVIYFFIGLCVLIVILIALRKL